MFIEINGHLVNTDHVVQVTPNGGVQLTGGSIVHAKNEIEHEQVRDMLTLTHNGDLALRPAPSSLPSDQLVNQVMSK